MANYTSVGYDAGTLDVVFSSDCSAGAAAQRMKTVYPDQYTVLTLCDRGYSYVVDPDSRGGGCELWPVEDDTCATCACPFCVRDTAGAWGDAAGGAVAWSSGDEAGVSPFTGEPVRVWRGARPNGDAVELAVRDDAAAAPVSLSVDSDQWLTISTWFDAVNTTLPAGVWDVPDICANLTPPARP